MKVVGNFNHEKALVGPSPPLMSVKTDGSFAALEKWETKCWNTVMMVIRRKVAVWWRRDT